MFALTVGLRCFGVRLWQDTAGCCRVWRDILRWQRITAHWTDDTQVDSQASYVRHAVRASYVIVSRRLGHGWLRLSGRFGPERPVDSHVAIPELKRTRLFM